MSDIVERLDELAAYFEELGKEPNMLAPIDASNGMLIRDAIKALSDARSAALEDAAKVADARARVSRLADKPSQLIHVSMTLAQFEAEAIATAIRALKEGAKPVDASPAPLPPDEVKP